MNVEIFNDPSAMTAFNFGLCHWVKIEANYPTVVVLKFPDGVFRFVCETQVKAKKQFDTIAAELAKAYKSA